VVEKRLKNKIEVQTIKNFFADFIDNLFSYHPLLSSGFSGSATDFGQMSHDKSKGFNSKMLQHLATSCNIGETKYR